MIWDATAWFSWFLYQADIALLKAFEKIEEFKNDEDELKKWSLEIEWEEDFTLFKDDWKNSLKELYQVKEYEKWTPWKYLDWIIKLYQCTLEKYNNDINCKTFICSKVEITWISNDKIKLIKKIKESEKKDILFQKCFCKLWIEELEDKVIDYKNQEWSSKKKTIISNYYLWNKKIELWKEFIDENKNKEKKEEIINAFNLIDLNDFETNFDFWNIYWFWNYEKIQWEIIELIEKIKPWIINWNYYLKFLESKVKRKIQENKLLDIWSRNNITLLEFKEDLNKDLNYLSNSDYQDIFLNKFIELFNKVFDEVYKGKDWYEYNIESISDDLWNEEEFEKLLDNIRKYISEKIFSWNTNKLFNFIKYSIWNESIENIDNVENFTNLNDLLDKIIGFDKKIKYKIQMLVSYFYALENNFTWIDNYFDWIEEKLSIIDWNNKWTITWLLDDKQDIKEFLKSNMFYDFEKTHLWICKVDNKLLSKHLWVIKIEDFDDKVKEYHKKKEFNITKTKDIKIFSWEKCLKTNATEFMN